MIATGAAAQGLSHEPEFRALRSGRQSDANTSSASGQDQGHRFSDVLANVADQKTAAVTSRDGSDVSSDAPSEPAASQPPALGLTALLANLANQKPADVPVASQSPATALAALLANVTDQKQAATPEPSQDTSVILQADKPDLSAASQDNTQTPHTGSDQAPTSGTPTGTKPAPAASRSGGAATRQSSKSALPAVPGDGAGLVATPPAGAVGTAPGAIMAPAPADGAGTVPADPSSTASAGSTPSITSGAKSAPAASRATTAARQRNKAGAMAGPDNAAKGTPVAGGSVAAPPTTVAAGSLPILRADPIPSSLPDSSGTTLAPTAAPKLSASATAALDTSASPDSPSEPPPMIVVSQETHLAMAPTLPPMQQIVDVVKTMADHASTASADRTAGASSVTTAQTLAKPAIQVLTLQLEPANLGTVVVKMRLSANALELHVDASNLHTANLLQKDKSLLSESLQASNYKVDALTISNTDFAKSDLQGRSNDPQPQGQSTANQTGFASSDSGSGSMGQGRGQDNPTARDPKLPDVGTDVLETRGGTNGTSRSRGIFV